VISSRDFSGGESLDMIAAYGAFPTDNRRGTNMRYADLTQRISGESVDTWDIHYRAVSRLQAGDDIFLMSVGQESDFESPAGVVDAAVDSLRKGRHHYTPVEGEPALRRAIAHRHSQRCGVHVDPEDVVVFSGAQNALFAAAQVLLQTGDEVILIEPYYTTYPATVTASGATAVSVPLSPESDFQLDVDHVLRAITSRTRAILVNSPNNPTGAVYARAPLQTLVDICREREIWLISDEVYADIVHEPSPCSLLSLAGAADVVVTVSSVSKSHRMTGWRIGWAIGPRDLAAHMYNLNMCMSYGLPAFTQDAALHALMHETPVTHEVGRRIERQREVVAEGLWGIPGTKLHREGGGMFLIFDIRELGIGSKAFAADLLEHEGVSLQPLLGFGSSCGGLVRVSAVLREERLQEACRRIARYVGGLRGA
jgi:arginine:pyruvate transaminase